MTWGRTVHNVRVDDRFDLCEHLSVGDIAPVVVEENDCFGPVAKAGYCTACNEARLEEEGNEEETCHDCAETFKKSELNEWRRFDFNARDGDVPFQICDNCWDAEQHQARIDDDAAQFEYENP